MRYLHRYRRLPRFSLRARLIVLAVLTALWVTLACVWTRDGSMYELRRGHYAASQGAR